ncbi:MAG: DMT family transporter, partial [Clostridia bacterium]|nr:DMT family transporter [Clostridia bacterium]
DTVIGGVFCGAILFVSTIVQQIGIESTTSGKAGFITVLYIVIVPILGVFARKRTSLVNCCAVMVAIMGFVLMCINDSFTLAQGDALVFCSAITFGFHILFVDLYCKNSDPIKFTFMQFATCAVIGFPFMAANGFPTIHALSESIIPLLYVGVLSSGLAYTLQVAGQKRVKASVATLIMSLESAIALFGGIIILGEESTAKELAGCLLVFIAVFIAQLEVPHNFLKFHNNKYFVE